VQPAKNDEQSFLGLNSRFLLCEQLTYLRLCWKTYSPQRRGVCAERWEVI